MQLSSTSRTQAKSPVQNETSLHDTKKCDRCDATRRTNVSAISVVCVGLASIPVPRHGTPHVDSVSRNYSDRSLNQERRMGIDCNNKIYTLTTKK